LKQIAIKFLRIIIVMNPIRLFNTWRKKTRC